MKRISRQDIDQLRHVQRINFVNSCSGYKSANLIGTVSKDGTPNVAVFSSVTHLGSNPPIFGFILRPTTVPRDTYKNIKETGYFTLNHIHEGILEEAHHTSAKYPEHISEFDMTQLEMEMKNDFLAPFVKGCPVQLEMKYVAEYPIEINGTLHVIGEVIAVHLREELLEDDGFVNLAKGKVATINGLDGYAVAKHNSRFSYQRPKTVTEKS